MNPFSYSTAGKPPTMKDLPEEEKMYLSLAAASNQSFTVDDVRVIRRIFDRADLDNNGFVDRAELEASVLSTLDVASKKMITAVLEEDNAESSWSFPAFVHWTRVRLGSDGRLKLMAQEIGYVRSMGIDRDEEEAQKHFSREKDKRKMSSGELTHPKPDMARRVSKSYANSTVPNDEDAYKREFGLDQ